MWGLLRAAHRGLLLLGVKTEGILVFVEYINVQNVGVLEQGFIAFFHLHAGGGRRGFGRGVAGHILAFAFGQAGQGLGQGVEWRKAEGEGLHGLACGNFLDHLSELRNIGMQTTLQAGLQQVQADQAAEQGQYAGQCQ